MSTSAAPLPPRDQRSKQSLQGSRRLEQRTSMIMTIVFFIIGLSVILSYNWSGGGFYPDAAMTIFFGILVAVIIYIASRRALANPGLGPRNARLCPACRRRVPVDALLCPYCGQRLP